MELVQGHPTTSEEFQWEFERNPAGDLNIFLAMQDGQIIGCSCHNTFRMQVDDREVVASFPLNVLTHPRHRGRGIFSHLEMANEEHARSIGVPFMLSFPNEQSTSIFLNKLGWTRAKPPRLLVRPGRLDELARRLLSRASPGTDVPPAGQGDPLLDSTIGVIKGGDLELSPIDSFGSWSSELSESFPARRCIARSADYLNWRFRDHPSGRYQVFSVHRSGDQVGSVVLGMIEKRGFPVGYVANAMFLSDAWDVYEKVRGLTSRFLRSQGAALCLDMTSPMRTIQDELRGGYLPFPRALNLIYKPLDPSFDSGSFARGWTFQVGDLDFF